MDKPSTPQTEKIQHSGENVVREYKETPLEEAPLNEYEALNPDKEHPVDIDFTQNVPVELNVVNDSIISSPEKKKSKKGLFITLGSTAAGLALAAGAVFGVNTMNANSQPDNEPVATAPAEPFPSENPEETETGGSEIESPSTVEGELTVASIEIPAGLTPEQYGEAFIEKAMTDWTMAGATEENELAWVTAEDSDKYLDDLVQDNADKFAPAIFTADGQNDPMIRKFIESTTANNRIALELYFKTFRTDSVPYKYSATANSTTVDSEKKYVTNLTVYNNGSENRAGELLPGILSQNDISAIFTYSTQIIDGKEKVNSLSSSSAN